MKNLFCIGELLIDWISTDIDSSLVESVNFIKKAGGAPANVAIAASRLGVQASFAGKVGDDAFGQFLKEILVRDQVDTQNLILAKEPTTFAFVSIKKGGARDFIFQRGADELLKIDELILPTTNTIFHFGSATGFLSGNLLETYAKTLDFALQHNAYISFDPNFRDALWNGDEERFVQHCKDFIAKADFIKLSDEEAQLISGKSDLKEAVSSFQLKEHTIVCVTLGSQGTLVNYRNEFDIIPSVTVDAIDTTGAGDAFVGAMLQQICQQIPADFEEIRRYVAFANTVGAISTTKFGAIEALPTMIDIQSFQHQ